jgi:hypothetical protein
LPLIGLPRNTMTCASSLSTTKPTYKPLRYGFDKGKLRCWQLEEPYLRG